jgi:SAM-dependent methyltransferase
MTDWREGAVTDIAPRMRFHRESMPIWLSTACAMSDSQTASVSGSFRYVDVGCGAGFDALTVAATCPRADVWGIDFNPVCIEAARNLADQAGLTNVRFIEASFASLASLPPDGLPDFDFIVAGSVLHVVSPENQEHLFHLFGRHSRPGCTVSVGYACEAGWTGFDSIQKLMRMMYDAGTETSEFAVPGILQRLQRLRAGGARLLQSSPMERVLGDLRRWPADELALEFLNRDWRPLGFSEVANAMARVKCDFVCRAALHENVASLSLPPAMVPLLNAASSIRIRETMHDIAAATRWRHDIYRRGAAFPPLAEQRERMGQIKVMAIDRGQSAAPYWLTPVQDDPELYQPLLDALRDGPLSVERAYHLELLSERSNETVAEAMAMLIAAGHVHPIVPQAQMEAALGSVGRLNQAIIADISRGAEIGYLVSSVLGSAIETNPLEALTVGALLSGRRAEDLDGLLDHVQQAMRRSGRRVVRTDVAFVEDSDAANVVREGVIRILRDRVPLLRSLRILPEACRPPA